MISLYFFYINAWNDTQLVLPFSNAFVKNAKSVPKVAGAKFYNHKHNKIQNFNEYTQAEPIL